MSAFASDLVASLVGSAFGVGLALMIDRWREAARRKVERCRNDQLRDEAEATQLRIAKWIIEENVDLAKHAIEALAQNLGFFSQMNTHLLDVAIAKLATTSSDSQLLLDLERFRYQLHHTNEIIRAHIGVFMYPAVPLARVLTHDEQVLVPSLRGMLEANVVAAAKQLLPRLSRRIQELSAVHLPVARQPHAMPQPIRLPRSR